MIRIVEHAFDPWRTLSDFSQVSCVGAGGIASFVGIVREFDNDKRVTALTLEHYPGMTEKQLAALEREAVDRWPLKSILIVHRVGRMLAGEAIVLVAVAASHRRAALEACQFIIDWLKTKAPIWKFEESDAGTQWVEANRSDEEAADRWI